ELFVKVAAYDPAVTTLLSSVTLQPRDERPEKPAPGLPQPLNSDDPKIMSPAAALAVPLETFDPLTACAAVTSRGASVSSPEYSWGVIDFWALNDASNVGVTFRPVPPATLAAYQISTRQPDMALVPVVGPTALWYAFAFVSETPVTVRAVLL